MSHPVCPGRCARLLVAFLALLLSAHHSRAAAPGARQSTSNEAALRSLVIELYARYVNEDADGFFALWDAASPDLKPSRDAVAGFFAAHDLLVLKNLTVARIEADAAEARVRVSFELSAVAAETRQPIAPGKRNRLLRLAKQDGVWKVSRELAAEDDLAERLAAPQSDAERKALLSRESELATVELQRALTSRARSVVDQGEFDRALALYRLAQSLAEKLGDKRGVSNALVGFGRIYATRGEYAPALECYEQSLAISEETKSRENTAAAYVGIGNVHHFRGDYARASEFFQKSLAIYEETDHKQGIINTTYNLGNLFSDLGDYAQSLEFFRRTALLMGKDAVQDRYMNSSFGVVYYHLEDYEESRKHHESALAVSEAQGDKMMASLALNNLGELSRSTRAYDQAQEFFRRSMKLKEEMGDRRGIAKSLNYIGTTHYEQGDHVRALEVVERAAERAAELGSQEDLWRAEDTRARALRALGRTAEARRAFEEAITVIENLRRLSAGGERLRQRFFEDKVISYHAMVGLNVAEDRADEALAYAEQAKARVLLDVLRDGRAEVGGIMSASEQEQERRLRSELARLNAQISTGRGQARTPADPHARLQKARLELEAFQAKLYAVHPELRIRRADAPPLTPTRAAELVADDETALLEYTVTADRTYLFVLTGGGGRGAAPAGLKVHTIDIKAAELTKRAEEFRRLIAARESFQPQARTLYDLLLRPVAAQLNGKRRLVVVPDGALWGVPFQALQPAANRFLLEDAAISYAPSLTALAEMRKRRSRRNDAMRPAALLAFGNPALNAEPARRAQIVLRGNQLEPLVAAEREVAGLRALYGAAASRVYTGREARERTVKQEAGRFRVLQFATHGVLDDRAPMYSHLVLSQAGDEADEDGLLEAWEMMNLDLRADLVVLSACETARGRVSAGEGVIGMSWALFVAGVPTTVVSGWKVSSEGTAELMLDFHRNLRGAGGAPPATKAEALRRAALKLMRSGGAYRHPFYWAAFSVVGDGG